MQNPIHHIRTFYLQTMGELGKCTWPTRQELFESTLVVIITVIIISLFVLLVDWLGAGLIRLLTF